MISRYTQIFREGYSHGYGNCRLESNKLYATKRSEGESVLVSLLFQFSADIGGLVKDLKRASDRASDEFKARREARRSKRNKG